MTDFNTQYEAALRGVAWHDRGAVGKIAISGEDRFTWLQGMVTQDIRILANNRVYGMYPAAILDATGHVLADLRLAGFWSRNVINDWGARLNIGANDFIFADVGHQSVSAVIDLLDRYLISEDVTLTYLSDRLANIVLYGPEAANFWEMGGSPEGHPLNLIASDTVTWPFGWTQPFGNAYPQLGPVSVSGFRSYIFQEDKEALRAKLAAHGVIELSDEVVEVLRVEQGIPKYGADMDNTTLAPEAGLMPTHISLKKGCYIGQEIVARIDSRGHTNRALTGLVFNQGEIPNAGDRIYAEEEGGGRKDTGRITSVIASSPAMSGRPIALGYVRHEHRAPGSTLWVGSEESVVRAEVVELPFLRLGGSPA